jgi:xanthine dehydrogenase accessory factor
MTESTLDEDWSVPETAVMSAIERSLDADDEAVLATIVDVEGNAYRRPGAKMVVSEAGAGVGSITAGCLESEVREMATEIRNAGGQRVERFDLTGDDDVWGLGLGCNGIIDLLFEPLTETYRQVVDAYRAGTDTLVVTVIDSEADAVTAADRLIAPDGDLAAAVEASDGEFPAWLREALADPAETLHANGQSDAITVERDGDTVKVFVDAITAPSELVLFGTGHDVGPVAELGRKMDYRVTVAGFRGGQTADERFPNADRVVSTSPADVDETLDLDGDTYAVVMTHNFIDDQIAVETLLDTDVPYVGLMGPDERFQEILDAFADGGREVTDADLDRIYTPIGLDLGGGTPYQIAMSILAEVEAVANGREPKHLRERKSPIHERLEIEAEV